jgi:hypothetical protein
MRPRAAVRPRNRSPATGGAALPVRPPGEVAARLTRIGPGHQPRPRQLRPHAGDQRDRHEPVEPAPFGPLHQDPGKGVPGSVDDRPAAVTGKGARVTKPVQLHRPGGGRASHGELPPHPVQRPLGQRIAEYLDPGRQRVAGHTGTGAGNEPGRSSPRSSTATSAPAPAEPRSTRAAAVAPGCPPGPWSGNSRSICSTATLAKVRGPGAAARVRRRPGTGG